MPFPVNDVAAYLVAKGLGTLNTDIFETFMPETPSVSIAVYETSGLASEKGFGVTGIQYEHPGIQIVFRGEPDDYAGPRTKAQTAHDELAKVQAGMSMGSTPYLWVDIQQAPFEMKRDGQRRVYIAFNIICEKEN